MRKVYFLFLIVFTICLSCKKDNDTKLDGDPYLRYIMDGNTVTKSYPADWYSAGSYSLVINNGGGKGYTISFSLADINSPERLFFMLGQLNIREPNSQVTFEMFKNIFSKGEKVYDSLVVRNQSNTNRVEVFYYDGAGIRWSSTHLSKDGAGNVVRTVNQPGSRFVIDNVKEIMINGKQGLRFKGQFNCVLYEEFGNRQKKITNGEFMVQTIKTD